MGKKGKKAAKVTGTPEVIKFKGTQEFNLLKECVAISETLPFVHSDVLDDFSFRKVARFLSMVGLLAKFCGNVEENKEFRFTDYHHLVAPVPQYFPSGYPADVINKARGIVANPTVKYNNVSYSYSDEFKEQSDKFLQKLDEDMTKIASFFDPNLKNDFEVGLKKFNQQMSKILKEFDTEWCAYEKVLMKEKLTIDSKVLERVSTLVDIERRLTTAENEVDIEGKQQCENELVVAIEEFTNDMFPETLDKSFKRDLPALALSEACLFYESKCTPEWLEQAKYVIKDYLELRIYIADIPNVRIDLNLSKNMTFMRLLKRFHASVIAAEDAFIFVEQLPKIKFTKKENWMTRKLLEPDLIKMKKMPEQ